jgi:hypothetical protein
MGTVPSRAAAVVAKLLPVRFKICGDNDARYSGCQERRAARCSGHETILANLLSGAIYIGFGDTRVEEMQRT